MAGSMGSLPAPKHPDECECQTCLYERSENAKPIADEYLGYEPRVIDGVIIRGPDA